MSRFRVVVRRVVSLSAEIEANSAQEAEDMFLDDSKHEDYGPEYEIVQDRIIDEEVVSVYCVRRDEVKEQPISTPWPAGAPGIGKTASMAHILRDEFNKVMDARINEMLAVKPIGDEIHLMVPGNPKSSATKHTCTCGSCGKDADVGTSCWWCGSKN